MKPGRKRFYLRASFIGCSVGNQSTHGRDGYQGTQKNSFYVGAE